MTYLVHHVATPDLPGTWIPRAELATYALPAAQRKIQKLMPAL